MSQMEWPICYWCKHYKDLNEEARLPHCTAFPEGIPRQIYPIKSGVPVVFDHRYSHPDDNDTQFEVEDDFNKIEHYLPIRLLMLKYKDPRKAYEYLEAIFKLYDERYAKGRLNPKIRT